MLRSCIQRNVSLSIRLQSTVPQPNWNHPIPPPHRPANINIVPSKHHPLPLPVFPSKHRRVTVIPSKNIPIAIAPSDANKQSFNQIPTKDSSTRRILKMHENEELEMRLRRVGYKNGDKKVIVDIAQYLKNKKKAQVWMPLKEAHSMMEKLTQLANIDFDVTEKITRFCMDRIKAPQYLGDGIYQHLYTHRVPGFLYGPKKSALYVSILQFKIDMNMRSAKPESTIDWEDGREEIGPMAADPDSLPPPQLFISQHVLQTNEFHAWCPEVYSIQMPVSWASKFLAEMEAILSHPNVLEWREKNTQPKIRNFDFYEIKT